MTTEERIEKIDEAQEKMFEVITLLKQACVDDENAKAYLIDYLEIMASNDHFFLCRDLNLDKLRERYLKEAEEES